MRVERLHGRRPRRPFFASLVAWSCPCRAPCSLPRRCASGSGPCGGWASPTSRSRSSPASCCWCCPAATWRRIRCTGCTRSAWAWATTWSPSCTWRGRWCCSCGWCRPAVRRWLAWLAILVLLFAACFGVLHLMWHAHLKDVRPLIPVFLFFLPLPALAYSRASGQWGLYILGLALLYGLLFVAASELVFWNEFSSRFNFIAVDYL